MRKITTLLLAVIILLIDPIVTDFTGIPVNLRRAQPRYGGYVYHDRHWPKKYTSTRIMFMFRSMIMALLADIHTKIDKITFMKEWSQKGKAGKAAFTARLIFKAQKLYNKMIRMYLFTSDNHKDMHYGLVMTNFVNSKKNGLQLDHLIQTILEYENEDPSGRLYGRSGPKNNFEAEDADSPALKT